MNFSEAKYEALCNMSQTIEGFPNLYNIGLKESNDFVINKLISIARDMFEEIDLDSNSDIDLIKRKQLVEVGNAIHILFYQSMKSHRPPNN